MFCFGPRLGPKTEVLAQAEQKAKDSLKKNYQKKFWMQEKTKKNASNIFSIICLFYVTEHKSDKSNNNLA